jgi:hypothetical protein
MNHVKKPALTLLLILTLISTLQMGVYAQQDDLVLETEQRWDTYDIGGTCIPGTHNLAIADIDADGVNEIVTGGFGYTIINGTRATVDAPLKIWSWDGQTLALEKSETWEGNIWAVYAADADGDGSIEILTSGSIKNNMTSEPALRFWSWDGQTLTLRATYNNLSIASIFISKIGQDSTPEIITVGRPQTTISSTAQLCIWNWNGQDLALKQNATWSNGAASRANSVYAADLNNDGQTEIVTAGYDNGLKNSSGQLRVWQIDGSNLSLQANVEWRLQDIAYASDVAGNPMGNTIVNNVKIADVDQDGTQEILTGGFTYDGEKVKGQLRIWNWTNGALNLEASEEFAELDITEVKSITVNDVDADGKPEVVTSGVTAGYGAFAQNATIKELAQLKIWSWNGSALTLEQSKDWIVDDGVCAWQDGSADLDGDGATEIVTAGCSYKGTLCDPNMRIWSMPKTPAPIEPKNLTFEATAITAALVIIAIATTAVIVLRKRKQTTKINFLS